MSKIGYFGGAVRVGLPMVNQIQFDPSHLSHFTLPARRAKITEKFSASPLARIKCAPAGTFRAIYRAEILGQKSRHFGAIFVSALPGSGCPAGPCRARFFEPSPGPRSGKPGQIGPGWGNFANLTAQLKNKFLKFIFQNRISAESKILHFRHLKISNGGDN